MRKVQYQYDGRKGGIHPDLLTATGWFHKFVVVQEGRLSDEIYAVIETNTGEIEKISIDRVKFQTNPKTSPE